MYYQSNPVSLKFTPPFPHNTTQVHMGSQAHPTAVPTADRGHGEAGMFGGPLSSWPTPTDSGTQAAPVAGGGLFGGAAPAAAAGGMFGAAAGGGGEGLFGGADSGTQTAAPRMFDRSLSAHAAPASDPAAVPEWMQAYMSGTSHALESMATNMKALMSHVTQLNQAVATQAARLQEIDPHAPAAAAPSAPVAQPAPDAQPVSATAVAATSPPAPPRSRLSTNASQPLAAPIESPNPLDSRPWFRGQHARIGQPTVDELRLFEAAAAQHNASLPSATQPDPSCVAPDPTQRSQELVTTERPDWDQSEVAAAGQAAPGWFRGEVQQRQQPAVTQAAPWFCGELQQRQLAATQAVGESGWFRGEVQQRQPTVTKAPVVEEEDHQM